MQRTGQKTTYGFIMACIELWSKLSITLKIKDLATHGTPTKMRSSRAQFQLFPAHLWVREF